jgi:hypothetical protein
VISGITNRASAIAGRPIEGFKLLPDTDRSNKAISPR